MPRKLDDATSGVKLLKMYNILMTSGRKHFQVDLAVQLQCSPQTVMRLAETIESVIGVNLESDLENRRRWYKIRSFSNRSLGLDFEEIRYLCVCRDLASPVLPEPTLKRIDESIFNLSVQLADRSGASRCLQEPQFLFFPKGRIDYTPHYETIDTLVSAIEGRQICIVNYKANNRTDIKRHQFAPSRIVSMSNALYVLGAGVTDDYQEIRHRTNLAVHRIIDVRATERTFSFDMPDPSANTFGLPWHEPKTFKIFFASNVADYVRERTWADEQNIEVLDGGGVILEIVTRSEPELMAWVRSFGDNVLKVETQGLRTNSSEEKGDRDGIL